jgi:hypothetical protein
MWGAPQISAPCSFVLPGRASTVLHRQDFSPAVLVYHDGNSNEAVPLDIRYAEEFFLPFGQAAEDLDLLPSLTLTFDSTFESMLRGCHNYPCGYSCIGLVWAPCRWANKSGLQGRARNPRTDNYTPIARTSSAPRNHTYSTKFT